MSVKQQSNLRNVNVNFLPDTVTQKDLRDHFQRFGPITSTKVVYSQLTGEHMGYGFVMFESEESAREAIAALNNSELHGKRIKVCPARGPNSSPVQNLSPKSAATTTLAPGPTGNVLPHTQQVMLQLSNQRIGSEPLTPTFAGMIPMNHPSIATGPPASMVATHPQFSNLTPEVNLPSPGVLPPWSMPIVIQQPHFVQVLGTGPKILIPLSHPSPPIVSPAWPSPVSSPKK